MRLRARRNLVVSVAVAVLCASRADAAVCVEGELEPMPESMLAVMDSLAADLQAARSEEKLEESVAHASACSLILRLLQSENESWSPESPRTMGRVLVASKNLERAWEFEDPAQKERVEKALEREAPRFLERMITAGAARCLGRELDPDAISREALAREFGEVLADVQSEDEASALVPRIHVCLFAEGLLEKQEESEGGGSAGGPSISSELDALKERAPEAFAAIARAEPDSAVPIVVGILDPTPEGGGEPGPLPAGEETASEGPDASGPRSPWASRLNVELPAGWTVSRLVVEEPGGDGANADAASGDGANADAASGDGANADAANGEESGSDPGGRTRFSATLRLTEETYRVAWSEGRSYVLEPVLEPGATRRLEGWIVRVGDSGDAVFELDRDPLSDAGRLRSAFIGRTVSKADPDAARALVEEGVAVQKRRKEFLDELRDLDGEQREELARREEAREAERNELFATRFAQLVAEDEWYTGNESSEGEWNRYRFEMMDADGGRVQMDHEGQHLSGLIHWEGRIEAGRVVLERRPEPGFRCTLTLEPSGEGLLTGSSVCYSRWPTGKWIEDGRSGEIRIELR